MELNVLPGLDLGKGNAAIGHGLHVVEHLRGGLQCVNNIAKHVFHDHFKGVLVRQRRREIDLTVHRHASTSGNTVGDRVNELPAAVSDIDFNIQVFEECVGKNTVVDGHGIVHAVAIAVGKNGVVQRKRCRRRDTSCLNVNDALRIGRSAGGVVTVRHARGIPRDDPHFVGQVPKSGHESRGDVVGKVEVSDAPEAIGNGFCDDHAVEQDPVGGQSQGERSR